MVALQIAVGGDSANSHPDWSLIVELYGSEHGDQVRFKLSNPEREITVSREDIKMLAKLVL